MIKKEDILNIAKLSNFKLNEIDIEKFSIEMDNILKILNRLSKIDTELIEPMYNTIELDNNFREDLDKRYNSSEDLIKLSEYRENNVIVVPKVIG